MKLLIAVPSKNRFDVLMKNAWPWLSKLSVDFKVFIEPQDITKYERLLSTPHIKIIERNNMGLGYAKAQIKKYAEENGYTHIMKVDDDVRGFTRFREHLADNDLVEWVQQFLKDCEKAFNDERVGAIAFPYSFEMFEKEGWTITKRLQTCYITPTSLFHGNNRISVFEDFAQGLYVLTQGKLIAKHGLAGISMGVQVGKGSGGHQSFNREKQALAEAEQLRKIYPPLNFRKVKKPWRIEPDISSVLLGNKL